MIRPPGYGAPFCANACGYHLVEAIAERPDGTRVPFIPCPTLLFDASGGSDWCGEHAGGHHRTYPRQRGPHSRYRCRSSFPRTPFCQKASTVPLRACAQRLFGYTAEEAIGKPLTILIPTDRQDEEPAILARIRWGQRVEHYARLRSLKSRAIFDAPMILPSGSRISEILTECR